MTRQSNKKGDPDESSTPSRQWHGGFYKQPLVHGSDPEPDEPDDYPVEFTD